MKLFYAAGSSCAIWTIGNDVFCKVRLWTPEKAHESEIIDFINEHYPHIRTPEVVHTWIDSDRSFLLIKRVPGETLQDRWLTLSAAQRDKAVTTVADLIDTLAQRTSDSLHGFNGKPLPEPWLQTKGANKFLEPLTREECVSYFTATPNHPSPPIDTFNFCHADLGPTNIMVSADGEVTGIIDWESAGFYPRFWIATKMQISLAFAFCPELPGVDIQDYARELREKLQTKGFPLMVSWYREWMDENSSSWRAAIKV